MNGPDPRHHYLSTACHHQLHNTCPQVCRWCQQRCHCGCHPATTTEETPVTHHDNH